MIRADCYVCSGYVWELKDPRAEVTMREIKFRVWDGETLHKGVRLSDLWPWLASLPRWYAEQYTGLKDKNGREIYEGDIVRTPCGVPMEVKWKQAQNVEYGHGYAIYANFVGFYFSARTNGEYEVIGNIHENGDLI